MSSLKKSDPVSVQDSIKEMTRGFTFDSIFGNEWPFVESRLTDEVSQGKMSAHAAKVELANLRADAKDLPVYDPGFFSGLPGQVYLATAPGGLSETNYFPSFFSPADGKFSDILLLNGRLKLSAYRCGSLIKSSGRDI